MQLFLPLWDVAGIIHDSLKSLAGLDVHTLQRFHGGLFISIYLKRLFICNKIKYPLFSIWGDGGVLCLPQNSVLWYLGRQGCVSYSSPRYPHFGIWGGRGASPTPPPDIRTLVSEEAGVCLLFLPQISVLRYLGVVGGGSYLDPYRFVIPLNPSSRSFSSAKCSKLQDLPLTARRCMNYAPPHGSRARVKFWSFPIATRTQLTANC